MLYKGDAKQMKWSRIQYLMSVFRRLLVRIRWSGFDTKSRLRRESRIHNRCLLGNRFSNTIESVQRSTKVSELI